MSGVDDHSRFCVSAQVVARATARPTCDALALAMRRHGVPEAILTDNGKVFTGRFGPGTGEVLFDRICRENGIKHLLTAPRSPTTTGKVERFHRTLRETFLTGNVFTDIDDAQAQLDGWVELYNHVRPHQGIGMVPPIERFRLAAAPPAPVVDLEGAAPDTTARPEIARRRVNDKGAISFASTRYLAGRWLAGETVEIACDGGVVTISHRGVVVATHARRHQSTKQAAAVARGQSRRPTRTASPRPSASSVSVTRKVDSHGCVCFAGTNYRAGNALPAPSGPGRHRRRHRRALHRRGAHPRPRHQARPNPRTRRSRQPRRPPQPNQRRLTHRVTQLPESKRHTGTGA